MNGNPRLPAAGAPVANRPRPSMSASPATISGNTPAAPNGQPGQPRRRRPRPQTDPMRPVYRPLKQISRPVMSLTQMNDANQKKAANAADNDGSIPVENLRHEFLARGAMALPLVVTRRDLKELRHHVMRLQAKGKVDILNEEQFTPPIRLHRRDPRAPPSGAGSHFEEEDTKEDIEEAKERERVEMQKEERRKIREENMAKIAPSGTKKPPAFQKKTTEKHRDDNSPEARKRQLLRYEETLPWHLEDFENKQTWVGTYESELSETHVMLTTVWENGRDVIQMAPMERWYRFNVKSKAKQNTADDADKAFVKSEKASGILGNIEKISRKREEEAQRGRPHGLLRTRVGGGDDDEGRIRRTRHGEDDMPRVKREADADDIDFNLEDDFADDEEGLNGLFEGEEAEVKDAAERLKRDQLGAALFDLRNEEEVYRQEEREKEEAEASRKLEKAMRKALVKREKDINYEDSDPENPYESESSSSDSDSEAERQRIKEEEERKAAEQNGKTEGDKAASGASTKGSNTPSGVHKSVDINKKKRPGSPNLSEASGNESSRKKHKKKHDKHLGKSSLVNDAAKRSAASGSDSEMTDASKPKPKLKVRLGASPSGSPGGSRAGSPTAQVNGSRAGSPAASLSPQDRLPTALEIYKELPPEGAPMQRLISVFKSRVDKSNTHTFIRLVKAVSTYDKTKHWLVPLPQLPSEEQIQAALKGTKSAAPTKSAAASPS